MRSVKSRRKNGESPAKRKLRLKLFSQKLKAKTPRSEQWFLDLFTREDLGKKTAKIFQDHFNKPLHKYIPDVINYGYRYIIEVDGSIHDTPKQVAKDFKKNADYVKRNYKLFRIRAFDMADYCLKMSLLKEYISEVNKLPPNSKISTTSIKLSARTFSGREHDKYD